MPGTLPVGIPANPRLLAMMLPRTLATLLLLGCACHATADVPGIISHQGRLSVAGTNFTGPAYFKFALVTTNAGAAVTLWSHDGTSVAGGQPTGPGVELAVSRGVFAVNLGDTTLPQMTQPIAAEVFAHEAVYLRTWVDDGTIGYEWLAPDRRVTAVGYAFMARTLAEPPASATNFTGPLLGDVTGTQGATVVSAVGGLPAVDVAGGAGLAKAATNTSVAGTLVRRDGSGNFLAGTVTAAFVGNGSGLTNLPATHLQGVAPSATNFTAPLQGDVTGPQGATVVSTVGGLPAADVTFGVNRALAATPTNVLGAVVRRDPCDASFEAGTITARFVGDGSGLTNLPTTPPFYAAPAGAVLVSLFHPDAALEAAGFRQFMSTAVPSWVNGSTVSAPSARYGQSTVWSGQVMIVWGGNLGVSSYANSGATYDPMADTWTAMSSVNAPTARSGHTTVWTGTQMVVWGGRGATGSLNTGGRYNPQLNTWAATATGSAPTARYGHVAVWTGTRMLVWGGFDSSGLLNDAFLYDPVGNSWSAIALPGAPEARMNAVAVWAGDRLVVWGGTGETGELNTGAQLVFSNGLPDHWTAMTTTAAPLGRVGHTAVWTGDRVIFWGGQNGGVPLDDGGVYCLCDEWKGVSSTNAPLPRYDHAAVWSGTEMFILGGANLGGSLSSGAGYDPITQQWRPLSNLGGPLARALPGAVWSGAELLVFGGNSGAQALATLQRLLPQPAWHFYRKL